MAKYASRMVCTPRHYEKPFLEYTIFRASCKIQTVEREPYTVKCILGVTVLSRYFTVFGLDFARSAKPPLTRKTILLNNNIVFQNPARKIATPIT